MKQFLREEIKRFSIEPQRVPVRAGNRSVMAHLFAIHWTSDEDGRPSQVEVIASDGVASRTVVKVEFPEEGNWPDKGAKEAAEEAWNLTADALPQYLRRYVPERCWHML